MSCVNKTCFKCGKGKPLSDFYRHPHMADGHLGKCKNCTRKDVSENRAVKPEKYRAYDNERARLPHRIMLRASIVSSYRDKNPERSSANSKLARAVKAGKIARPDACWYCGKEGKPHGHHFDYREPLLVTWLCAACHKQCHRITDLFQAQGLS